MTNTPPDVAHSGMKWWFRPQPPASIKTLAVFLIVFGSLSVLAVLGALIWLTVTHRWTVTSPREILVGALSTVTSIIWVRGGRLLWARSRTGVKWALVGLALDVVVRAMGPGPNVIDSVLIAIAALIIALSWRELRDGPAPLAA